eukprot:1141965-Prymnesium_polylepis.1
MHACPACLKSRRAGARGVTSHSKMLTLVHKDATARASGWVEKLDRGAKKWAHGSKRRYAVFHRSQLKWFDKEPENGGFLHGVIDLRMADVLR